MGIWLAFLLDKYIGLEWLDSSASVCLTFYETSRLPHFGPQPAVYESLSSSTHLAMLGMVSLFHVSHSNKYVVVYHCGLNMHFPDDR